MRFKSFPVLFRLHRFAALGSGIDINFGMALRDKIR
jgi:hypothetical protein